MKTMVILLSLALSCQGAEFGKEPGYVLHEWGTFTTVSGSDGVLLAGLEREEEHLPAFVYSHFGMENGSTINPEEKLLQNGKPHKPVFLPRMRQPAGVALMKGFWRRPVANVTVKMETPVIYFYTEEELKVNLRVGFRGGSISQWYPQRSGGEQLPVLDMAKLGKAKPLDFAKGYQGHIRWEVDVLPRPAVDPVKLFTGEETVGWMHPKVEKAAVVRNALGEHEDYLFYRGLGNFALPVKLTVDAEERLEIKNDFAEEIPFAFVFENTGEAVRYAALKDGVAAGESVVLPEEKLTLVSGDWKEAVYVALRDGLVASGLYREEADGMVRTWWKSYFQSEGLKVFWVVPEAFTEEVLPLEVEPAPREAVRILVGRSEVLRPRFEKRLLAAFTGDGDEGAAMKNHYLADRFGVAYQARVNALMAVSKTPQ